MGSNRWTHLMFVVGGLLLALLMVKTTEWIWGYFAKPEGIVADAIGISVGIVIALMAWRNQNIFTKASEITMELKKVTWPTRKETSAATVVVIFTVIIASVFLGVFDIIWSSVTGYLYA